MSWHELRDAYVHGAYHRLSNKQTKAHQHPSPGTWAAWRVIRYPRTAHPSPTLFVSATRAWLYDQYLQQTLCFSAVYTLWDDTKFLKRREPLAAKHRQSAFDIFRKYAWSSVCKQGQQSVYFESWEVNVLK